MDVNVLGHALRDLRAKRGLGAGETAHRAGITKGALQHWEAGRNLPTGPILARVLDVLEADDRQRARLLAAADPRHARIALANTALGPPVSLGAVLRAMRKRRLMSQSELARAAGVTQSAVAKWELGDSVPSQGILHAVAYSLGAAPEEALALAVVQGEADPFVPANDPEASVGVIANTLKEGSPLFDVLAASYEAEAWRRATRDPRWDPALCRVLAGRAAISYHRKKLDLAVRISHRTLRLAQTVDAKRASMKALDVATTLAKHIGDDPAHAASLTGTWGAAFPNCGEKAWALWIRALRLNEMGRKDAAMALLQKTEDINAATDAQLTPPYRAWSLIASRVEFHLAGEDARAAIDVVDQDPWLPGHFELLIRVYHANDLAAPVEWMESVRAQYRVWPNPGQGRVKAWHDDERLARMERCQARLIRRPRA